MPGSAKPAEQLEIHGLDSQSIKKAVKVALEWMRSIFGIKDRLYKEVIYMKDSIYKFIKKYIYYSQSHKNIHVYINVFFINLSDYVLSYLYLDSFLKIQISILFKYMSSFSE